MNVDDLHCLLRRIAAPRPRLDHRPREEELVTKPDRVLAAETLREWWTAIDVRGPDECWPVTPAPYRQRHIRCEGAIYLLTGRMVNFTSLQPLCKTFACCNPAHQCELPPGEPRRATPENWLT
jgi:hypothetical protein